MHLFNKKTTVILIKPIVIMGIFFMVALPMISMAQNNSSPYSVLGIGNIEDSYYNRYTGMAGASVSLSDSRYINNSNAASLSSLLPKFFSIELSGRYRQIFYSGDNVASPNDKTSDFQMKRINLAAKITKRWGSSVGLMPFSTSNYSFSSYKNIQGTLLNVPANYEGQGGVNQFYWANGYQLTKNISIGVTSSLLFGSLNQTETIETQDTASTLITTNNNYLHNLYFNFSLLAKKKLGKHWLSTFGITYNPITALRSENTINVTDSIGAELKADNTIYSNFKLPMGVNAGIALIKDSKYTFTINAKTQSWGNLNYVGANYQLVNSSRFSIGFQKSNLLKNYYNLNYEKSFFQLGLYGGNSYLKVNGQQLTDFGATIGYGQNSARNALGYVAALEIGRQGSYNSSVLSENYVNLTLTFSFLDFFSVSKKF